MLTENATLQAKPKKRTMLPVLVVLFLISYGLLALLVVEQNRTITAQRSLIQQLFSDTIELTAMKGKLLHESGKHAPGAQGPSSQVAPKDDSKSKTKSARPMPLHPPKDASDTADARRSMHTI